MPAGSVSPQRAFTVVVCVGTIGPAYSVGTVGGLFEVPGTPFVSPIDRLTAGGRVGVRVVSSNERARAGGSAGACPSRCGAARRAGRSGAGAGAPTVRPRQCVRDRWRDGPPRRRPGRADGQRRGARSPPRVTGFPLVRPGCGPARSPTP